MIYAPKAVRRGIKLPFGYFVNPLDPYVALPDKEKLEALHYAFRMKAQYGTSLRNCTMWLHSATGQRMTPHGFKYSYDKWLKDLKKKRKAEIDARKKETLRTQQKYIDDNFKAFETVLNEDADITSVAKAEAKAERKKKKAI